MSEMSNVPRQIILEGEAFVPTEAWRGPSGFSTRVFASHRFGKATVQQSRAEGRNVERASPRRLRSRLRGCPPTERSSLLFLAISLWCRKRRPHNPGDFPERSPEQADEMRLGLSASSAPNHSERRACSGSLPTLPIRTALGWRPTRKGAIGPTRQAPSRTTPRGSQDP
jgi:hypothetical protein